MIYTTFQKKDTDCLQWNLKYLQMHIDQNKEILFIGYSFLQYGIILDEDKQNTRMSATLQPTRRLKAYCKAACS